MSQCRQPINMGELVPLEFLQAVPRQISRRATRRRPIDTGLDTRAHVVKKLHEFEIRQIVSKKHDRWIYDFVDR